MARIPTTVRYDEATDLLETVPATSCSCGCAEPHRVARRETADGRPVEVWNDGSLTIRGFYVRGLGTPRTTVATYVRRRAVEILRDDLSLLDSSELARAVKLAESTVLKRFGSDAARARFVLAGL